MRQLDKESRERLNYNYENDYELIYRIREENEDEALQDILQKYLPIIKSIAFSLKETFNYLSLDEEDLIQEGRIALVEAVRTFDTTKEVLFYTYVILLIRRSMLNYVRFLNAKKNTVINFSYDYLDYENFLIDEVNLPDNYVLEEELFNYLTEFKNSLTFEEALIFEMRFNSFSYDEIANFLEISKKRIDNTMNKIRKKLKKYLLDFRLLI